MRFTPGMPDARGKTTLAYVLMGCEGYVPSAGTMLFNGNDLLPLKMLEQPRMERLRHGTVLGLLMHVYLVYM